MQRIVVEFQRPPGMGMEEPGENAGLELQWTFLREGSVSRLDLARHTHFDPTSGDTGHCIHGHYCKDKSLLLKTGLQGTSPACPAHYGGCP